jgi:regulator of sirC expression with transglutaminase-like and TPR domain
MPSKEIKELRQAGKLDEALTMAKAELEAQPDNIWGKRNISWVYYDLLKQNVASADLNSFISNISAIKKSRATC